MISLTSTHYPVAIELRSPCTDNMVEYAACMVSLEAVLDMKVKDLEVYRDSILIINQSTGEFGGGGGRGGELAK